MKLSFIILNYKTSDHLRLCIENIKKMHLPFEHEIIVIDNASADNSVSMVKDLFPEVTLIVSETNVGHPAGNNIGLKKATGDYLVMVNPDIVFRSAGDIEKIVAYLDAHETVSFLGPKLHNPDGTVQNSCYRRYSKWTPVFRRTILGKLPSARQDIKRHLMLDFNHDETIEVEWLLGACMFIRKKAMDEIGMMNDELFLYFGDYEWCDRARQQGWKVIYFHDTEGIFHYHKRESASSRFSVLQAFSYITRIHIKDWRTYLKISKYYAKSSR